MAGKRDLRITITASIDQCNQIRDAADELGIYPSEYLLRCVRLERLIAAADGAVHVVSSDGAVERIRFV